MLEGHTSVWRESWQDSYLFCPAASRVAWNSRGSGLLKWTASPLSGWTNPRCEECRNMRFEVEELDGWLWSARGLYMGSPMRDRPPAARCSRIWWT